MSRVHRVAWRLEKPGQITWDLLVGVLFAGMTVAYALGWYEPDHWDGAWLCAVIACCAFGAHQEARREYRTYVRFVRGPVR